MSQTILITGGAGFIGTNLCKRLLKEGNKVICVDNLYTGQMRNIEPLMKDPNFKFIIWLVQLHPPIIKKILYLLLILAL